MHCTNTTDRLNLLFLAFYCCLIGTACTSAPPPPGVPYHLEQPNKTFKLPGKLTEISGLTWMGNNILAGIQDEDGFVFLFDVEKGEVADKIKFEKDGDYEGIAKAKEKLYILRSDGDLYKVKDFDTEEQATKKYETKLKEENDTEGLCYDAAHHRLLIACKDKAGLDKKIKHSRTVYAFDLKDKKLKKEPLYTIDLKAVKAMAKAAEPFLKDFDFMPSGIAIHPISQDRYLISSVGKLLVVLDPDGELKTVVPLKKDIFKQPEGITFNEKGDLYISNEGRNGKANILFFEQQ